MEDKFLISVVRQVSLLLVAVIVFITVITHDLFSDQRYVHHSTSSSQRIDILIKQPIRSSESRQTRNRTESNYLEDEKSTFKLDRAAIQHSKRNGNPQPAPDREPTLKYTDGPCLLVEENRITRRKTTATYCKEQATFLDKYETLYPELKDSKPDILLVTYMRSGSTFLAEIIQQVPGVFYVYEPLRFYLDESLNQFYYRKHAICSMHNSTCRLPPKNTDATTVRVLHDITKFFNCKFTEIQKKFLRKPSKSQAIKRLRQCDRNTSDNTFTITDYHQKDCLKEAMADCTSGSRLIKTIRLSMGMASVLLKRNPNLKIIHLLRDPRGIINSRSFMFHDEFETTNKGAIANSLCEQLLRDIELSQELRKHYPTQIKTIQYENLAENPHLVSKDLFHFLGLLPPPLFRKWLTQQTSSGESAGGYFGTQRSNSTETAYEWRRHLSARFVNIIDNACSKVYKYMGFKPINNKLQN